MTTTYSSILAASKKAESTEGLRGWDLAEIDPEGKAKRSRDFALYVPLVSANLEFLESFRRTPLMATYFWSNGKAKARQYHLPKHLWRGLWDSLK